RAAVRPDLMRRVGSSRPRRCGMDTDRGLDNSRPHGWERAYGGRHAVMPAIRPAATPSSRTSDQRPGRPDVASTRPGPPSPPGRNEAATRLIARRHGLCRILPERAGVGRVPVSHARDDTKMTWTRSAPMRLKAPLYLTVAAIGIASVLAAAPAQLRAQT